MVAATATIRCKQKRNSAPTHFQTSQDTLHLFRYPTLRVPLPVSCSLQTPSSTRCTTNAPLLGAYCPTEHGVHAVAPATDENCPAGHAVPDPDDRHVPMHAYPGTALQLPEHAADCRPTALP